VLLILANSNLNFDREYLWDASSSRKAETALSTTICFTFDENMQLGESHFAPPANKMISTFDLWPWNSMETQYQYMFVQNFFKLSTGKVDLPRKNNYMIE